MCHSPFGHHHLLKKKKEKKKKKSARKKNVTKRCVCIIDLQATAFCC
jgi:hypothetical protein